MLERQDLQVGRLEQLTSIALERESSAFNSMLQGTDNMEQISGRIETLERLLLRVLDELKNIKEQRESTGH